MPAGAPSAATHRGLTRAAPRGRAKRSQILAAAAELIAAHGVDGMTMRQLASACGLNIATLYHYFRSKSDLLGAIVDERHYDAGLRDLALPLDPTLPPGPRLEQFFTLVARRSLGELRLWRLLIGEGLRDDAVALAEARRLSSLLDQAVDRWLGELFPELDTDPAVPDRPEVTSVVTGQLLAVFLEEMLLGGLGGGGDGAGGRSGSVSGDGGRAGSIARRAAATARVVFPGSRPRPT